MGSSFEDLLAFPATVRKDAGYQLHKIQHGLEPEDWKPFSDIGPGVNEVRLRDASGTYRVMYVSKFDKAIYVLHSFQKKVQQTSKYDKNIAKVRFQSIIQQRRGKK
ncbi:type II toxin-antitoxin system RelE/ParE family toxin [Pectobacteriaceae bacterium CE70]|nr:type II toxin-antitoxin system RelE/ParE family toxin [Pectobacteriaceae bacterium C52]WJV69077.1 type II toxin-antitoxin system RelE/ParE family toxin [Pectobacteriaceae bacterium CE70]WJY13013.1 type II toxin-antitoxin system RelE/ParE family toxin [Pectobacteriaceae bacterium C80]